MFALPSGIQPYNQLARDAHLLSLKHIASPAQTIQPKYFQPSRAGQIIAATAMGFWNKSSRHGPDQGNLACAFMVNEVLQHEIGKMYGLDPTTVNSVRDDLLRQGGQILPPVSAEPGDLALAFNDASLQNQGGATAHIGIVIAPNTILANSSSTRRFNALFDFQAFSKLYKYFEIIRPVENIISRNLITVA